jgi:hypothetical protein
MFRLFKRKKKVGCPVCHESNMIGFGADYLESKYDSRIEQTDKIGNIQIYKCMLCQTDFYREGNMYQRFANGQINTLREFVNLDLQLDEKQKNALDKIGLTTDWNMNRQAPVKIRLKNGEILDFVTIQVTPNPPIGYFYNNFTKIIFIDYVDSIERSEYAISKEIREMTKGAEERRMGFYPTVLKTNNGENVVINGQALFFKNGDIKGRDLLITNENWNHLEKYIYEKKIENQILVIAKK